MAKSFMACAALVAVALCFFSFSANAEFFNVEGDVYCDTCRVEFQTPLSKPLPGARLLLECRCRDNNTVTFSKEAVVGADGKYSIFVDSQHDHEDDICEISLVSSPDAECSDRFSTSIGVARVLLTNNVGFVQPVRFANPIGYKAKVALPECGKVLEDMGFLPLDVQI